MKSLTFILIEMIIMGIISCASKNPTDPVDLTKIEPLGIIRIGWHYCSSPLEVGQIPAPLLFLKP